MRTTRALGLGSAVIGLVLLLFTFTMGFSIFQTYRSATPPSDLARALAAIQALYLGIMGCVGSLLTLRGIDFEKVERGVGVVTFKVVKVVGIVTQQSEPETRGS